MSEPRRFTLDTNLLVYAVDKDARNKYKVASVLLETAPMKDCVMTLQAIGEFINVVSRKKLIPMDEVTKLIWSWQEIFRIVPADFDTCAEALGLVQDHKIPYWDAMLWMAAKQAKCAYVLSEDMQHGRRLNGVEVVNPFAKDAKPIIERLYK